MIHYLVMPKIYIKTNKYYLKEITPIWTDKISSRQIQAAVGSSTKVADLPPKLYFFDIRLVAPLV